jgi:hypothetical protein
MSTQSALTKRQLTQQQQQQQQPTQMTSPLEACLRQYFPHVPSWRWLVLLDHMCSEVEAATEADIYSHGELSSSEEGEVGFEYD